MLPSVPSEALAHFVGAADPCEDPNPPYLEGANCPIILIVQELMQQARTLLKALPKRLALASGELEVGEGRIYHAEV